MKIFPILTILSVLFLTSCASNKPYPCPSIKLPPEPRYPYKDLKPGDDPDVVFKALVSTIILQQDTIKQYKYIATGEK
jgi:hypothetical protein